MRVLACLLALLVPLASAAPVALVFAVGEAIGPTCAEALLVTVAVDANEESAAMQGTASSVDCPMPYSVWPPGACAIGEDDGVRCELYYPVTAASVTTLYFHKWLNMTLDATGAFRFTSEHERSPQLDFALEGTLQRVDA